MRDGQEREIKVSFMARMQRELPDSVLQDPPSDL